MRLCLWSKKEKEEKNSTRQRRPWTRSMRFPVTNSRPKMSLWPEKTWEMCEESKTNMVAERRKEHMAWIIVVTRERDGDRAQQEMRTYHQLAAGNWRRHSLMSDARWHRDRRGSIRRARWLRISRRASPQWCHYASLRRKEKPLCCWKWWKSIRCYRSLYGRFANSLFA